MAITSRVQLLNRCKRDLGIDFMKINISDQSLQDKIDDAIDFFIEFHDDALYHSYEQHQVTADDITNGYITVNSNIDVINKVIPIEKYRYGYFFQGSFFTPFNNFASNVYNGQNDIMNRFDMFDYEIMRSYISLINERFSPSNAFEYNRFMNRLYIFFEWGKDVKEDEWIVFDCKRIVDPELYPKFYNNLYFRRYVTVLMKEQWAFNLSKFKGNQTVGSVKIGEIANMEKVTQERKLLEEEIKEIYRTPCPIVIG